MGLFNDKCSFCGAKVKKGAQFCPECGAEMHKCPYCKGDIAENVRVCPHCFAEFTKPRFLAGKCPQCGKEVSKFRQFCPHCGADAEQLLRKCPECGALAKADSQFCSGCGKPLAHRAEAVVEEVRWRRNPGEFAHRFDIENIRGVLTAGVTVDHGTRAMLIQDGAFARTLEPGFYNVDTKLEEVKLDRSVSVLAADTSDTELDFAAQGVFAKDNVKLDASVRVVVNLADPARFLANVMKQDETYSVVGLTEYLAPEVRNAVEEAIRQHDGVTLRSEIATKENVSTFLFNHLRTTLDRVGLHLVQVRTLDLVQPEVAAHREARGKTAMMEDLLDLGRKRIDVWDELKKLATSKRMLEVTNEEEWQKFTHEVDKDRLIRKEEMDDLKLAFLEKRGGDFELARKHLLAKIAIQQALEQKRISRMGEAEIDQDVLEVELKTERARLEAEMANERLKELTKLELDLKRQSEEAKTDIEIKEAKVKLGFIAREKKIEMDHKEETLAMQRRLEEEQKRAELLSKASTEALIAMAKDEKTAGILADLRRTEQMKGLSEEQILALAAEKSPKVAEALAEKFKAAADGRMQKELREAYERVYKESMERMERVATAAAGPHVTYPPPMGGAAYVQAPAPAAPSAGPQVICPNCKNAVPAGSKFCDTCGHKLA